MDSKIGNDAEGQEMIVVSVPSDRGCFDSFRDSSLSCGVH